MKIEIDIPDLQGIVRKERHIMIEWVDVNKRLPDEEGEYITMTNATGKNKGVIAQRFCIDIVKGEKVKRWKWYGKISPWKVTHWMPLPEPPKEREGEGEYE